MKGGVIRQFASPHEIYHRPANLFVAGFIGSPAMNTIDGTLAERDGAWRFDTPGLSVGVSRYPFASAPKGGPATLGVRPEHIGVGEAPPDRHAATGKVTIVEPMGGEAVVWTSLAGKPATIKVAGDSEVKVGDDLRFYFDVARASLFDGQTGQRL
jgi:multiple sugar transport system ATP-binding protein